MTRREQIARIVDGEAFELPIPSLPHPDDMTLFAVMADRQRDALAKADQIMGVEGAEAHHISEYHEDHGDVLWWTNPVDEPPYIGSPLSDDWRGHHEWWTPRPKSPKFLKGPTHD